MKITMKGLLSDGSIHAVSGNHLRDVVGGVTSLFKRRLDLTVAVKQDYFADGRLALSIYDPETLEEDEEPTEMLGMFLEKKPGFEDPEEYFRQLMEKTHDDNHIDDK